MWCLPLTFRSKYLLFSPYLAQTLTALQPGTARCHSADDGGEGCNLEGSGHEHSTPDLVERVATRGLQALLLAALKLLLLLREAILLVDVRGGE